MPEKVLDVIMTAEAIVAKLLDDGPTGKLQRQLLADGDEQTFMVMAKLLNNLRGLIDELDDRE